MAAAAGDECYLAIVRGQCRSVKSNGFEANKRSPGPDSYVVAELNKTNRILHYIDYTSLGSPYQYSF